MKGTIIITDDGRQAGALETALQQAGATVTSQTGAGGSVRFLAYEWPGSEDELRNVIERASEPRGEPGAIPSLDEVERRHITRVLNAAHGNKTLAARILGVDRKTLHRKLSQYARTGSGQPENGVSSTMPG
jgi:two-component system, NtrC family, response regulator HydG